MSAKPSDLVVAIREANQNERRAESDARASKSQGVEHVCSVLTETFKALKPLAQMTDNEALSDDKIGETLLRFWKNAR